MVQVTSAQALLKSVHPSACLQPAGLPPPHLLTCPRPRATEYASFFVVMGAWTTMVFSAQGAAYGTAKSGAGIATANPEGHRPRSPSWHRRPLRPGGAVPIASFLSEGVSPHRTFL